MDTVRSASTLTTVLFILLVLVVVRLTGSWYRRRSSVTLRCFVRLPGEHLDLSRLRKLAPVASKLELMEYE